MFVAAAISYSITVMKLDIVTYYNSASITGWRSLKKDSFDNVSLPHDGKYSRYSIDNSVPTTVTFTNGAFQNYGIIFQSLTPSMLDKMMGSLKSFLLDKTIEPESLYKAMKVGI